MANSPRDSSMLGVGPSVELQRRLQWAKWVHDLYYPAILCSMLYDLFFNIDLSWNSLLKASIVFLYMFDYLYLFSHFDEERRAEKSGLVTDVGVATAFCVAYRVLDQGLASWALLILALTYTAIFWYVARARGCRQEARSVVAVPLLLLILALGASLKLELQWAALLGLLAALAYGRQVVLYGGRLARDLGGQLSPRDNQESSAQADRDTKLG